MDLWTQILGYLSQIITPVWNDLIPLLPFAMIALAGLILLLMATSFMRNGARNRSRVPRPRPPVPPAGVHLPGPSLWPLVVPIGGTLILLALVFPGWGLPINPILLVGGLGFLAIAIGGWLWDAGREWRQVETGVHGDAHGPALAAGDAHNALMVGSSAGALTVAGSSAVAMPGELQLPPGVHLPGPSPWPFFAPIGFFFVLLGMVFGWALILGGILMVIIAVAGWFRDAGYEYKMTEETGHAEPKSRDPSRVFPTSLLPIFGVIAVAAVVLTMIPIVIGALPGNQPGAGTSSAPAARSDTTCAAATRCARNGVHKSAPSALPPASGCSGRQLNSVHPALRRSRSCSIGCRPIARSRSHANPAISAPAAGPAR